jgi:hypothetical protein
MGQPPMGQPPLGQPGSTWLMKNRNPPAFAPPAPSEAAASWANHASLANDKAQDALRDIIQIKTDALSKVNQIAEQARKVMEKVEALRQSTVTDFNKESIAVFNNYMVAKDSVLKMLKMAEGQLLAAKKIAQKADHNARILSKSSGKAAAGPSPGADAKVTKASFAQVTSFPKKVPKDTGNPEIDPILKLIREYMAKINKGKGGEALTQPRVASGATASTNQTVNSNASDPLKNVAENEAKESAKQSVEELDRQAKESELKAIEGLADSRNEAAVKAFMARLSMGTLMHDTAAAVSAALKSARDAGQNLIVKEINAEKDILDLLRQAQQTSLDAANEAIKAETVARRAADFTRLMATKAKYAQNAAGQAMAAQMAQAMGYPVAVKGEPSPFSKWSDVQQASTDSVLCSVVMLQSQRKERVKAFI